MQNKRGYEDLESVAEDAGYGMAALVITSFTNLIPGGRNARRDGMLDLWFVSKADISSTDENYILPERKYVVCEAKGTRQKRNLNGLFNIGKDQAENMRDRDVEVYVVATEFQTPSILSEYYDFRHNI